jgi:hypothetical protein
VGIRGLGVGRNVMMGIWMMGMGVVRIVNYRDYCVGMGGFKVWSNVMMGIQKMMMDVQTIVRFS